MMILKNKRTISIRSPSLRKIRDNFRSLILEVNKTLQHKLADKRSSISRKVFENSEGDNKISHDQIRVLNRKLQQNRQRLYESIVVCPVCFATNKDMTYNPVRKKWYCTECYEVLKDENQERGTPEEFP
ncbi:MAG: hypothetical protein KAW51_00640 [Candidatus Lokiarchaeota archaeon]|nr:hypothetical protein [Candidatus Lokiarchaeota archaeon]